MRWHEHVRACFVSDGVPEALLDGLKEKVDMGVNERIKRLKYLFFKADIYDRWDHVEDAILSLREYPGDIALRDGFLEKTEAGIKKHGQNYLSVIKDLTYDDADIGRRWLRGIVDAFEEKCGL
jgi:hypothetical protein